MTLPPANPAAPVVLLDQRIPCGAGTPVTFGVRVQHRGQVPARVVISVLGLDADWLPAPVELGELVPGQVVDVGLTLTPSRGAPGAEYPFVVAAQAMPVPGGTTGSDTPGLGSALGTAESVLVVNARERVNLTLQPTMPVAVFGRRFQVQLTNPSSVTRDLTLSSTCGSGAAVTLDEDQISIPPGASLTVSGRIRVTRPRIIGHHATHPFVIGARGLGAPAFVEGTLRSRPLLSGKITGLIAAVAVIALWVTAVVVAIPKISQATAGNSGQTTVTSTKSTAESGAKGSGSGGTGANGNGGAGNGASGNGGAGNGAGGNGAGGNGAGGNGSGGSGGSTDGGQGAGGGAGSKFSGTVTGEQPGGVLISLEPTSLVRAASAGASPVPGTDNGVVQALRAPLTTLGKIPAEAVRLTDTDPTSGATDTIRTTTSATDGSFSFAGISAPGYYLLTLSRAGYRTQRFIINAADLVAAPPFTVGMQPGDGSLSGSVTGPDGPVGAATITITDGTVSLQTSSSSDTEAAGSWVVKGLSTPGAYLVSASAPGYGTASKLVTVDAGGTATADLDLKRGVALITGTVTGRDSLGRLGGLGGLTVVASGSSRGTPASRTATTVTSGPVGRFQLPDLPTPGDYTVTVTGQGFATQTRSVHLDEGAGSATVDIGLTRADGEVTGTVNGSPGEGGLTGVGLTLTGNEASFKTMTTSSPAGGFRFSGVAPGTYVLTAEQFGRTTSSATVQVNAAGTATANLTLAAAPGSVVPTNSRVRGRVVDARTQGPLTCDRAATPAKCLLTVSTVDSAGRVVSTISGPADEYTLPELADKKVSGLAPGLYTVTLTAPGYETASTVVQVGQGQVVPAPQIALQPLSMVSGTVTVKVGAPTQSTCVLVVAAGQTLPSGCQATKQGCTAAGSASARCVLTAADGSYQIRGLTHGGYQILVLPRDPEYRAAQPLAAQLDLASDFRYDPVLDRIGRITVTTLLPDVRTLELDPAAGTPITVTDAAGRSLGTPLGGGAAKTGADGTLTITRVTGTVTVSAASPGGNATAATLTIADNQTATLTLVLADPVGAVVGHLGVNVDPGVDQKTRDVAGVSLTITGVIGFNGRTPVSGSATVTTDANGCYAIIPVDWPTVAAPALTGGPCTTPVTDPAAIGKMTSATGTPASIIALPITMNVQQNTHVGTSGLVATGVLITGSGKVRQIPDSLLTALPSPVGTLPFTLSAADGTFPDPSNTQLSVTRAPAGAGVVSLSVGAVLDADTDTTASRALVWRQNGNEGLATPGRYTVTATKLGYATATADIWCDLGKTCTYATFNDDGTLHSIEPGTVGGFTEYQLPRLSGQISRPDGDVLPTGVTLDKAVVTVTKQPGGSGSITTSVNTDGAITVKDLSLPAGVVMAGDYGFTVTLAGYTAATVTVHCGTDLREGCQSLDAGLTPLPRFAGSIALQQTLPGDPDTLVGATVTVTGQPDPDHPVAVSLTSTTATSSTLVWADPAQPAGVVAPADYTLVFSKPGYASRTIQFHCTAASPTCDAGTTTLKMFPRGTGSVTVSGLLPGTDHVDWSTLAVTFSQMAPGSAGTLAVTAEADPDNPLRGLLVWKDSGLPLAGTTRPGGYAMTVSLPGYGSATSGTFSCAAGDTTCGPDLSIALLPVFNGSLSVQSTVSPDPSGGLTGVNISITNQPNPTKPVSVTLQSTSGTTTALQWSDPAQPAGIVTPGSYTLVFAKNGYQSVTTSMVCGSGGSCGVGTVVLKMFPRGGGSVTVDGLLPGQSSVDWSHAKVTLINQAAGSSGLTVSVAADSSDQLRGQLVWSDAPPTVAGTTRPGDYLISVAIPGYRTVTSTTFSCAAGDLGCGPDLTTTRLPQFTGSVDINATITTSPAQDRTGITIQVGTGGAGQPTVTLDTDTGKLSWQDPTLPAGIVAAGTYQLTFSKAGYRTTTATLTCTGSGSTCDLGTVTLPMLPHGTGSITVNAAPPSGGSADFTDATVSVTGPANTANLTVSLVADPSNPLRANLSWVDTNLPYAQITVPGDYRLRVTIPGYAPVTSDEFTCTAGQSCGPTLTATQQPKFSGTVVTDPVGPIPAGTVVSVLSPAGVSPVTATVDSSTGAIAWQETGAPASLVSYGEYQLTVSAPGYLGQSATFSCTSSSCSPPQLVLTQPSTLQLLTVDGPDSPVNGATFTLSGSTIASVTVSAQPADNSVSFPTLSPLGNYRAQISAPGYADADVNSSSTSVTCQNNGGTASTGLAVQPGGTTACTVTLSPLGVFRGSVTGVVRAADQSIVSSTTLNGAAVSLQQLATDSSGAPVVTGGVRQTVGTAFTGTTDSAGSVTVTGSVGHTGLNSGLYQVTVAQSGYTSAVGTVRVNDTHTLVGSGLTDALPVSAGLATVQLTVKPVAVQVHLLVNGSEAAPAVKVALTGTGGSRTCTISGTPAGCGSTDGTVVSGTGGTYVNFPSVSPGIYTVNVTSASQTYRTVTMLAQIIVGIDPQALTLSLDQRSSKQTGKVTLGDGSAGDSATTVSLRPENNISVIAKDPDNHDLAVHPDGSGNYVFPAVPDGRYVLMAERDGYAPAQYTTTVVMDSSLTTTPVAINLQLTTRATRSVNLTLTSTATPIDADGSAVDLVGAVVKLHPPTQTIPGLPADAVQTLTIGTGNKVTVSQLGTGDWTAELVSAPHAPFGATLASTAVTIDPTAVGASATTQQVSLQLQQARADLSYKWPTLTCTAAPTALTLSVAKDGGTPVDVTTTVSGGTASAQLYLPTGSFTFKPKTNPTGWTAATGSFTVPATAAGAATVDPITLAPAKIDVPVVLTVTGGDPTGFVATATAGATSGDSKALDSDGKALLCLAPGTNWTVALSAGTSTPAVNLPGKTVNPAVGSDNGVTFAGRQLTPTVELATVTGRPADTTDRTVDVVIRNSTDQVNAQTLTIKAGQSSATGTAVVLDAAASLTIDATPSDDVFGTVTGQAIGTGDPTVTLPYAKVMLTVNLTRPAALAGATVTVKVDSPTGIPDQDTTGSKVVFADVAPGTYTVSASASDGGTPAKTYTGKDGPTALAAGVRTMSITLALPSGP